MKLPDKVYLNKYMIRPEMLHPAEFPPDNPEEEYIRKEAVLALVDKLDGEAPPYDDSRIYLGKAYDLINSL